MAWSVSKVRQLFTDDPVRLKAALGKPDIDAQARVVVAEIRAHIPVGADWSDPNTWADVAIDMGVNNVFVLDEKHEDTGIYDWIKRNIYINPNTDDDGICRRIVHELAHDVQAHRRVGRIREGEERYDDNRQRVQHLVACRVVTMLLGERKPML